MLPALRPHDKHMAILVVLYLKIIAATQNLKHEQQRDTHLCIRTALELLEHAVTICNGFKILTAYQAGTRHTNLSNNVCEI